MASINMTPKAAFENIQNRLYAAIKEGKEKAGIFESIMEATGGSGLIDLGEDALFGDEDDDLDSLSPDESNPEQSDTPAQPENNGAAKPMIDLGEEAVFGGDDDLGEESPIVLSDDNLFNPTPVDSAPKPAAKRRVRKTAAEREAEERQHREKLRQLAKDTTFSSAEIREGWLKLFSIADKNKEYLTDAGQLVTEDEVQVLFLTEYNNYSGREHTDASDAAITAIPDIFKKKLDFIVSSIDERLHGRGDFMRNGSIVQYLMRAGTLESAHRTIRLRRSANLGIKDKSIASEKTDILNQFILKSDLDQCMAWLSHRFNGYNVPHGALEHMALEILGNGVHKGDLATKLGGKTEIPHTFDIPKYGTISQSGDNAVVMGPQKFLENLNRLIAPLLPSSAVNIAYRGLKIEDCDNIVRGRHHGGVKCIRMNAAQFLSILNRLTADSEDGANDAPIIPIAFKVGMVATDSMTGSGDKNGTSGADALLSNKSDDGTVEFSAAFGERRAANGLMRVLHSMAARDIARIAIAEKELSDAVSHPGEIGALSEYSSSILKWLCDVAKIPYTTSSKKGITILKPESEKSIVAQAAKSVDLSNGKHAVVQAAMLFNNSLLHRFSDKDDMGDISDIPSMSAEETRKAAMPILQIGDLAEMCYDNLSKNYDGTNGEDAGATDILTIFGKGYIVYRMGALFDIDTRNILPLVTDMRTFNRQVAAGTGLENVPNVNMLLYRLTEMGASDVVSMANRLTEVADEMDLGNVAALSNEEITTTGFYVNNSMKFSDLEQSGLLQAIAHVTNMEPMECVCRAAEILTGMDNGSISKYYSELTRGVDKNAIVQGARYIKKHGGDLVDIAMTDSGKEVIKKAEPKPAVSAPPAVPTHRVAPRRVGRGRF